MPNDPGALFLYSLHPQPHLMISERRGKIGLDGSRIASKWARYDLSIIDTEEWLVSEGLTGLFGEQSMHDERENGENTQVAGQRRNRRSKTATLKRSVLMALRGQHAHILLCTCSHWYVRHLDVVYSQVKIDITWFASNIFHCWQHDFTLLYTRLS
jgi:hypothetical protein